jgi:hypothetical protein
MPLSARGCGLFSLAALAFLPAAAARDGTDMEQIPLFH